MRRRLPKKDPPAPVSANPHPGRPHVRLPRHRGNVTSPGNAKPQLGAFSKDGHPKALIETLSEDLLEIKTLVVDDKWIATLAAAVQGELDRVSQTLTGRIRQLAERYASPLPQLTDEVEQLADKVAAHLQKMGVY